MKHQRLKYFRNEGFGWVCKNCEQKNNGSSAEPSSRLLREGESETKYPKLSGDALAKWKDNTKKILYCPRCETQETVN